LSWRRSDRITASWTSRPRSWASLRGAKALELADLRSDCGFVLDHASEIGEVVVAAPTYQRLIASFTGVEAHAGVAPEEGRNAIAAAAGAIASVQLGRLDEETTANVGVIAGGTAPNVVPGRCQVEAEVRSLDDAKAAARIGEMVDACSWSAGERGVDLDVDVIEMFRSYRVGKDSRALPIALEALRRCGFDPVERPTGGGSDANALRANGFDALLLSNGTFANHTPDEFVPARNLDRMLDVCEALVAVAAAPPEEI
jgi:tripeptide aminopeptidase